MANPMYLQYGAVHEWHWPFLMSDLLQMMKADIALEVRRSYDR